MKEPSPRYKVGDIVGTEIGYNNWGNSWYKNPKKIVKVESYFGTVPYKNSADFYPGPRYIYTYTLEDGSVIKEKEIKELPELGWPL